jgi:hypothetical protein
MKLAMVCFVAWVLMAGCQNRRDQIVHLYSSDNKAFVQQRSVNEFALQLSYLPASLLMKSAVEDTGFYYFKLNVVCPVTNTTMSSNKTELFYGIDSLFATAEALPLANPVLVEPVITGSQRHFEYLLVFDKKDFKSGEPLKVVFFDRLFTNTKQVFVFDRIKIDEIETLQSPAHEA